MASYGSSILRDDGLLPLPNAEEEVRSIAGIVGRDSSRVAVGDEASEALFKEQAPNYRILHLATHFLGNDRQPLYSKLALARDSGGNEDGYLQVYELLDEKLRAELVVLSACNTGLGRLQRGEGLLGATRAFLYAGVPSMVVSLWSVEDRATAEIMERFYLHLREGLEKRDALRQAKLDYLYTARGGKRKTRSTGRRSFSWETGPPLTFPKGGGARRGSARCCFSPSSLLWLESPFIVGGRRVPPEVNEPSRVGG